MKTLQLSLATLMVCWFLTSNSKAQTQAIDSLKIIPTNPTTNDTIKLIIYSYSPYTPCDLDTVAFDTMSNKIFVSATPVIGIGPATCTSIDTLTIGKLSAATYELICDLGTDAPPTTYDSDTLFFTVQQSNGFQFIGNSNHKIKIYPNPFATTTTISIDNELLTSSTEIRMYDILGREVKRISKTKNKEVTITRDNLTSGLYFLKLITDDKIIDARKIIVE